MQNVKKLNKKFIRYYQESTDQQSQGTEAWLLTA
jgi:hypothetical protein